MAAAVEAETKTTLARGASSRSPDAGTCTERPCLGCLTGQLGYIHSVATVVFGDFEWDEEKARSNVAKHGVSFEEATTVFLDLDYLLVPDLESSDRFLALGYSSLARLLVVVHAERGERIRLISARRATRGERNAYETRRTDRSDA